MEEEQRLELAIVQAQEQLRNTLVASQEELQEPHGPERKPDCRY